MTDGVNATMNPMQSAGSDPPLDRVVGHARRPELGDRQHSVLLFGNPADVLVACGGFLVDMTYKPPQPSILPLDTRLGSRCECGAVLVDGGIRRGVDIAIALALGADAVLVGRPALWGLAAAVRIFGLMSPHRPF